MSKLSLYNEIERAKSVIKQAADSPTPTQINPDHELFQAYNKASLYLYNQPAEQNATSIDDIEKVLDGAKLLLTIQINPFVLAKNISGIFNKKVGVERQDRRLSYDAALKYVKDNLQDAKNYLQNSFYYVMDDYGNVGPVIEKASRHLIAVNKVLERRTHKTNSEEKDND